MTHVLDFLTGAGVVGLAVGICAFAVLAPFLFLLILGALLMVPAIMDLGRELRGRE